MPEVLDVDDDGMARRLPMRVRTQLTLLIAVAVALAVGLAGLFVILRSDNRDAEDLDRLLSDRVATVRQAATRSGALPTDGSFVVRLTAGSELRAQAGSEVAFPLPVRNGYSTVSAGGADWRSLAEPLVSGAQLQILISLADLEERHTDNVLVVDLLVLLAALLSAVGVWFATGLVLRPYQRMVTAAKQLDPADPGSRLPEDKGPREVAELASTVNSLLDRSRASAAQVRPAPPPIITEKAPELPVAEIEPPLADLGSNLDTLLDNPEMPATQRHLILAAMADDHRRLVTLLEAMRPEDIKNLP